MDSAATIHDISAQTLNAAANFLSALNASFDAEDAAANPFANFLSQTQMPAVSSAKLNVTNASSAARDSAATVTPTSAPIAHLSLPALKKLVSTLRDIFHKLQPHDNGNIAGHKSRTATAKVSSASSQDSSNGSDKEGAMTSAAGYTSSSATPVPVATVQTPATPEAASAVTNPPTISDILAELQQLALAVEKRLQVLTSASTPASASATSPISTLNPPAGIGVTPPADNAEPVDANSNLLSSLMAQSATTPSDAQTSANTDAAANSQNAAANTDGSVSAVQALTDLLAFIQLLEKKFGDNGGDSVSSANTDNTQTTVAPSDKQMKADLKSLLDSLRPDMTRQRSDQNTDMANALLASETNNGNLTAVSANNTLTGNGAPQVGLTKNVQAQQDNILNAFTIVAGDKTDNKLSIPIDLFAAPGGPAMAADSQEGPSLDLDLNSQGNGASASAQGSANAALDNNILNAMPDGTRASDPYSFASQLSATRATSGGATGLPSAVEQVILQLNRNVKSGNDQMTLQLHPAELGRINIKLDFVGDNKVQGTVVVNNPATLHLLLKDVRSLERALQEAGLRADPGSLQFSLGGQSGNSSRQLGEQSPDGSGNGNTTGNGLMDETGTAIDVSGDATEIWYLTPGRVNMKV